jgi:hypothetical protein
MDRRRFVLVCTLAACALPASTLVRSSAQRPAGIVVRVAASVAPQPVDGRLLLLISKDDTSEPRAQVSATSLSSAQVFGVDVEGITGGDERTFDAAVLGYPLESLTALPPGEYTAQALLHKYETFRLATGHTVKLPMDRGEGQQWNAAPGNIYSAPQKIRWDGGTGAAIRIELDKVIPPITDVSSWTKSSHRSRSRPTRNT